MGKHARVQEVIASYKEGGMVSVARYLSDEDMAIDPSTWTGKMKRLLDSNNWRSMEAEIASLMFTFNLTDNERKERTPEKYKSEGFKNGRDSSNNN